MKHPRWRLIVDELNREVLSASRELMLSSFNLFLMHIGKAIGERKYESLKRQFDALKRIRDELDENPTPDIRVLKLWCELAREWAREVEEIREVVNREQLDNDHVRSSQMVNLETEQKEASAN